MATMPQKSTFRCGLMYTMEMSTSKHDGNARRHVFSPNRLGTVGSVSMDGSPVGFMRRGSGARGKTTYFIAFWVPKTASRRETAFEA